MKLRWVLLGAVLVAGVLVAVVVTDRTPLRTEYCVARVGETRAQVDVEQARWSALMAAMAQNRGLPPRATTIAIATAFQESKVRNIDFGDRDSVGLFQQRPSQGWGTVEEILDPHYAIGKFYDGLEKVDDYTSLEITVAAQEVQRSAFPGAYAQHEDYARALASALRGYSPAAFTCQVNPVGGGSVRTVAADVDKAFGEIPRSTDDAEDALTYHLDGAAADVRARGWALAHYLVANAADLQVASVTFDGLRWTAESSPDGWVADEGARDDRVVMSVR
ncbi:MULTISPECIES: hypothetical protein [unclassified Aeromicrobium]|uniref:hypothetical protein n=1 Tax=unclassified Aeromicrobium TaxID=2633570 RepID=UPI00288AF16F|nr:MULTISPECIES: hypothetical protein [unclassified Aeromicrobium]